MAQKSEIKSITVVIDNDYPPFSFLNPQGKLQGILIDEWMLWEKKTGIRANLMGMDWAKCQEIIKQGKADVIDTIMYNEEREKLYDFSKPYVKIEVPLFYHKSVNDIQDIDSLHGFVIGVKRGDNVINELKKKNISNLLEFNRYEEVVKAATNKKLSVFTIDKPAALYYLNKLGIEDKFQQAFILYVGELHRAVKKGRRDLLGIVENGFSQISDHEKEIISRKWIGSSNIYPYLSNVRYILYGLTLVTLIALHLVVWNYLLQKKVRSKTLELHALLEKYMISEEKYRSIFENSPAGIFQTTPDGRFINVNLALARIHGFDSVDEFLKATDGMLERLLVDHIYMGKLKKAIMKADAVTSLETRVYKKGGDMGWVSLSVRPFIENGTILYYEGIVEDVTQERLVEMEFQAERERFRILIENAPIAFVMIQEGGKILYVNPRFIEIFGYTLEDVPNGKEWFKKAYPEHKSRHKAIAAWTSDLKYGNTAKLRTRTFIVTCKDGTQKTIRFVPVKLQNGDDIMVCEDISEQEKLQLQLIQSQKMEAMGRLVAGIAHDFNNLLSVIAAGSDLLLMKNDTNSPLYNNIIRIKNASERGAQLVRQLLTFSRGNSFHTEDVNVNEIIAVTNDMLSLILGKNVSCQFDLHPDLRSVNINKSHFEQILLNIITNANDAMPEGGMIKIKTYNKLIDGSHYLVKTGLATGDYIVIQISDTGTGMDQDTVGRIFEPFYSTKTTGTGLGLSTVYGIVKQCRGSISVKSKINYGTTFEINLPTINNESIIN
ncbi:MAG: transporter substrate-binding domain-containing protein [Proteobacteria bacterium]|nr:transporter substrate-binding domain-containing protein [Pseudomonadota bacterium]